ncbi:MAG TPA: heavy metal translocating P-type ATPase [Planctomycetaceae bacterium]|nr:heavy metal translocating P-type ATPase [Planctomycetaceae bacterium]
MLPCVHCGESTLCQADQDPSEVFCCTGCLGAYQLIHGWGLDDFYALRDQMRKTNSARAAKESGRYEQFDSSEFLGASAPTNNADGTCSTELALQGLHCAACAWLIEKAAARQAGLLEARVKMHRHTVQLTFDRNRIKLSEIARFLDRLGYSLAPFNPDENEHYRRESRQHLVRIACAGFLAANAMWIAVALYAGEAATLAIEHRYFMTLVGTALGVLAVAGPGRTFLKGGLAAIRNRTPHMDLPIALGLTVGSLVGGWNAIRGSGQVYFDSLAVLVFLLLIGRWIQFRQQQRAASAVDLMLRITPRHCQLVQSDANTESAVHTVPVEMITPGDVILVDPGESAAADGVVCKGVSSVDRSLITGESLPVAVAVGDEVAAGVVNLSGPIHLTVTAVGKQSRIGRVMQSVEEATTEKTPIVAMADRIGGYFVCAVIVLAGITFGRWMFTDLATAASHATSLLIVACPCALALATPLAIAVGLGRAATAGVLVRDGEALGRLSKPGYMWLDKTGTLTEGKQRVTEVRGSSEALELAAVLEKTPKHPIARAIRAHAEQLGILSEEETAERVEVVDGGVIGVVGGHRLCVGNEALVTEHTVQYDPGLKEFASKLVAAGTSPVFIAVDAVVKCVLGVSDPLRPDAQSAISKLKQAGWKIGILSGDHPAIVAALARRVGLDQTECFGGLTPEDKLERIRGAQASDPDASVVMVGDGANDAAALAKADVGIALRGGAEVSLQAAPVFVANGKLASIPLLIQGSTATTRLIYLTFGISLLYNLIAVGLAICGVISPLIAAVLMPISSASVLAVTLAVRTFQTTVQE